MAMLRQYGTPTFFITFSSAETKWYPLLVCLAKTVQNINITDEEAENLTFGKKADLIKKRSSHCCTLHNQQIHSYEKPFVGTKWSAST